jgi:AAA ATPase domain
MATPLLRFTPSAQEPEVLEQLFVQREPLLQDLVSDVKRAAQGKARRHRLLIGPRGIGKSHIVAMLSNRLNAQPVRGCEVVLVSEDLWGIRSFADLVREILGTEQTPSDELAEQQLRAATANKLLVLIIENFDSVLSQINPSGVHRLRSVAEDCKLLIVATAPQLFDQVSKSRDPFYGFFDIEHLDELSLENACSLLQKVAALRDDQALGAFLATDLAMARLQAIRALAGGHPRIWMLFAGCISVQAMEELVPLFIETLDDLTPYYQSRVGALPPQQQAVVLALCKQPGALTNGMIAELAHIGERQSATITKQLVEKGFLRPASTSIPSIGDDRLSWWELREPLLRLSLDVKQTRGKPLKLVVEFLREWFGLRLIFERTKVVGTLTKKYIEVALDNNLRPFDKDELFEVAKLFGSNENFAEAARSTGVYEEIKLGIDKVSNSIKSEANLLKVAQDALSRGRYSEELDTYEKLLTFAHSDSYLELQATCLVHLGKFEAFDALISKHPGVMNNQVLRFREFAVGIAKSPISDFGAGELWPRPVLQTFLAIQLGASSGDRVLHESWIRMIFQGFGVSVESASLTCVLDIFDDQGYLDSLASCLVSTIDIESKFVTDWNAEWQRIGGPYPQLQVALRILDAAAKFSETRDRENLLRLAKEERTVLESVLNRKSTKRKAPAHASSR